MREEYSSQSDIFKTLVAQRLAPKNVTPQDAYERITHARVGSLANATPAYLAALRRHLHEWGSEIDKALATVPASPAQDDVEVVEIPQEGEAPSGGQ